MNVEQALAFRMPFGRHKGRSMKEIKECDPNYIDWIIAQPGIKDPVKTAAVLANKEDGHESE